MNKISTQAPSSIVMIRPHNFTVNTETAIDNAFQYKKEIQDKYSEQAYQEISKVSEALTNVGINVHMFEDKKTKTPDSVFPNNWFSTHSNGNIVLYPMKAVNRRLERRKDIIAMLQSKYNVNEIIDYSKFESDNLFLEGTGSMVLDHVNHIAYVSQSSRTHLSVLDHFCKKFDYEPVVFSAKDENKITVYHTNILMCVGTKIALVGFDMITNKLKKKEIINKLEDTGHEIIHLNNKQIVKFAGNAIELQGKEKCVLALSKNAYESLIDEQISTIQKSVTLLPLEIPTIEYSGGSVRCTIADIHLTPKN